MTTLARCPLNTVANFLFELCCITITSGGSWCCFQTITIDIHIVAMKPVFLIMCGKNCLSTMITNGMTIVGLTFKFKLNFIRHIHLKWCKRLDSNQRSPEGRRFYRPLDLATLPHLHLNLAGAPGFEPRKTVLETVGLPLAYTPIKL